MFNSSIQAFIHSTRYHPFCSLCHSIYILFIYSSHIAHKLRMYNIILYISLWSCNQPSIYIRYMINLYLYAICDVSIITQTHMQYSFFIHPLNKFILYVISAHSHSDVSQFYLLYAQFMFTELN